MDTKLIGKRIKEARQQRGWTQAELAQQVNMSLKHICAIECRIRLPSLEALVILANQLQIDANTLLQDSLYITTKVQSSALWEHIKYLSPQKRKETLRILQILIEDIQ